MDEVHVNRRPLVELLQLALQQEGHIAIHELCAERTVFRIGHKEWRCLPAFLDKLRARCIGSPVTSSDIRSMDIADSAYDLTIDKFTHIPCSNNSTNHREYARDNNGHTTRTDCRYYYRALLDMVERKLDAFGCDDPLDAEIVTAETFQQFVQRHFYLSLREAKRQNNPHASRYAWKLSTGTIVLMMPTSMNGTERRRWLEARFPEVADREAIARDRIQLAIDHELLRDTMVPLESIAETLGDDGNVLSWAAFHEIGTAGIAEAIASEKAVHHLTLRPAVRKLGPDGVYQLVHRIVDDLVDGALCEATVATDFGLSRSTVTRFAGIHWDRDAISRGSKALPDLWRNLAQILAHDEKLQEAARTAGVWDTVKLCLHAIPNPEGQAP